MFIAIKRRNQVGEHDTEKFLKQRRRKKGGRGERENRGGEKRLEEEGRSETGNGTLTTTRCGRNGGAGEGRTHRGRERKTLEEGGRGVACEKKGVIGGEMGGGWAAAEEFFPVLIWVFYSFRNKRKTLFHRPDAVTEAV